MQEFLIAPVASRAMWFLVLVPGVVICLVVGVLGSALLGARGENGERALVYLTDGTRAVHVPTTAGYSVLFESRGAGQIHCSAAQRRHTLEKTLRLSLQMVALHSQ